MNNTDGRSKKARENLRNNSMIIVMEHDVMHCGLCNGEILKDMIALKVRDENNKPWFFHTSCPRP